MLSRSVGRVVLVGIVLGSLLTSPAAAAGPGQNIYPLDRDAERVAAVVVNGQQYVIYRYDNLLPYADGIEVFSGGTRITSEETVDEVFTAYARVEGTTFDQGTVETLDAVVRHARTVNRTTSATLSALNETLRYARSLKNTTVNDTTAWERAVEVSPAFEELFEEGVTGPADVVDFRTRLMTVRATARQLEAQATTAKTLLERQRNGREVNRSRLFRAYLGTLRTLAEIDEQLTDVNGELPQLAESSRTAASEASSIPTVGSTVQDRLTALATRLEGAREKLSATTADLRSAHSGLPTVSGNERVHDRLLDQWHARRGSGAEIYVTIGEAGLAVVAGVLAMFRVR